MEIRLVLWEFLYLFVFLNLYISLNSHRPQVCVYFAVILWFFCRRNQPHADHILILVVGLKSITTTKQPHRKLSNKMDCGWLVASVSLDSITDQLQSCGWLISTTSCGCRQNRLQFVVCASYYHASPCKILTAHKSITILRSSCGCAVVRVN